MGQKCCHGNPNQPGGEQMIDDRQFRDKIETTRPRFTTISKPQEENRKKIFSLASETSIGNNAIKLQFYGNNPEFSIKIKVLETQEGQKTFQVGTLSSIRPENRIPTRNPKDIFIVNIKYVGNPFGIGQFYMRDGAQGLGCFYKLLNGSRLELKKNMILRVGDEFIVTSSHKNSTINGGSSRLSLDGSQSKIDQIQVYGQCIPSQSNIRMSLASRNRIKIGRSPSCDIVLNDPLVSPSHCTLIKEQDYWIAVDGSQFEASSTGTWVYLSYSTRLENNMVLRCGSTQFYSNISTGSEDST